MIDVGVVMVLLSIASGMLGFILMRVLSYGRLPANGICELCMTTTLVGSCDRCERRVGACCAFLLVGPMEGRERPKMNLCTGCAPYDQ